MQIVPGTRLGPYELGPLLGQGGMGAVYRARDTRLDRSVAIKVLPAAASADPHLRERLAREARAISALSHPNICALYDVGSVDGTDYLVMELLDGETLATRIARGPLPQSQAISLGVDIALALDAAHRAGLIHRDLKPANVMLTRNGARLLDFGLAKVIEAVDADAATARAPITQEGMVVGTLRYMAPEQLEGRGVDARTDIFALGLVLYEMLAGKPAFNATSKTSLIAAVLSSDPLSLRSINPDVTPELERIVNRCLEKDPDNRWQSARDLAEALRWSRQSGVHAVVTKRPSSLPLVFAVAVIVAAAAVGGYLLTRRNSIPPAAPVRFSVSPPAGFTFAQNPVETQLAVSPDGRSLALIAVEGRRRRLFVRSLDELQARPLDGTEDAAAPFWSPDSKWIAFFAGGFMKKVPAAGGPVETIHPAQGNLGSWSRDHQIVFSEWGPKATEAAQVISDAGGQAREVTGAKLGWSMWPSFLPDGRHFVYLGIYGTKQPALYVSSIDEPSEVHRLVEVRSRGEVRGEWLHYVRDSVLVRQHLDLKRLALDGDPVPIARPAFCFTPLGSANFSVSEDGATIAFQRAPLATQLVWHDWSGHELARAGKPELYRHFALSNDGQRIAADIFDAVTQISSIALFDVQRGVWTKITSNVLGTSAPVWLPRGDAVIVTNGNPRQPTRAPNLNVLTLADGSFRPLSEGDGVQYATDVTGDGRNVIYTINRGRYQQIEMLPLDPPNKITALSGGVSWNESDAVVSPDQRWLAFQSDESARQEIYIRPFLVKGEKLRVSSNGGGEPQWADNSRLLYIAPGGMLMKAELQRTDRIRVISETPLFRIDSAGMMELDALGVHHYLVAGDRILTREIPGSVDVDPVVVLVNAR